MTLLFRLLEFGDVPPAAGPAREYYLRDNGSRVLEEARGLLDHLTSNLDSLTAMPRVKVSGERDSDLAAAVRMREEWDVLRSEIAPEELARHRPDVMRAADLAVRALNFLEDTELAIEAHELIHTSALLRAGLYGCSFWIEKGEVWSDCPIRVSHLRFGVSVEMTTVWNCSICDERFDMCIHDPETFYEVVASHRSGSCTLCLKANCEHKDGVTYCVQPTPTAAAISSGAVAWVARPRYPQARVTRMSLPYEPGSVEFELAAQGVLFCDLCRLTCPGLKDFFNAAPFTDSTRPIAGR